MPTLQHSSSMSDVHSDADRVSLSGLHQLLAAQNHGRDTSPQISRSLLKMQQTYGNQRVQRFLKLARSRARQVRIPRSSDRLDRAPEAGANITKPAAAPQPATPAAADPQKVAEAVNIGGQHTFAENFLDQFKRPLGTITIDAETQMSPALAD